MELTQSELKYATAIAQDMDLMIRAREYTNMEDTDYSTMDVLAALHGKYPGGVIQFHKANAF